MTDTQFGTKGAMLIIATLALGLVTAPAQASLTLFTGADDGAGSLATAPNSTAAAASFDAAVAALGTGITLTGANVNNNPQSIVNTTSDINLASPCTNPVCGYNTTPGGSQFLLLFGGTAT